MVLIPFLITKLLFMACMFFIIGYVFGPFQKRLLFLIIARVASILVLVLFFINSIQGFSIAWGIHSQHNRKPPWCNQLRKEGKKEVTVFFWATTRQERVKFLLP